MFLRNIVNDENLQVIGEKQTKDKLWTTETTQTHGEHNFYV